MAAVIEQAQLTLLERSRKFLLQVGWHDHVVLGTEDETAFADFTHAVAAIVAEQRADPFIDYRNLRHIRHGLAGGLQRSWMSMMPARR